MSHYELVINGSPYTVDIVEISNIGATVAVNGSTYEVEIVGGAPSLPGPPIESMRAVAATPAASPSPRPAPPAPTPPAIAKTTPKATPAAVAPEGGEVITAPMPGHILSVAVKEGDSVAPGDTVALMEAMKMENEIKARAAGKVVEVRVAEGQDVGVGEVLVVIGSP